MEERHKSLRLNVSYISNENCEELIGGVLHVEWFSATVLKPPGYEQHCGNQ